MLVGTMKHLALAVLAIALGCSVAAAETLTESLQGDTAGLYAAIKEITQRSYVGGPVKIKENISWVTAKARKTVCRKVPLANRIRWNGLPRWQR